MQRKKEKIEDLLDGLKFEYIQYKECKLNSSDIKSLAYIQGYCVALENILKVYFDVPFREIFEIKNTILGDIVFDRVELPQIIDKFEFQYIN